MDVLIQPKALKGTVTPPPSKSMAHRAVLALMLAEREGILSNLGISRDIQATQACVAALQEAKSAGTLPHLDCGESGSTLRFLLPISLAVTGGGHFTGRGRLMERPQKPYLDLFEEKGISYTQKEGVLTVRGTLLPGLYRLPGNVSSQFVTGLLYALPLLEGDSEIQMTSPLESASYVDMTLDMLERFGITIGQRKDGFLVPGGQRYRAKNLTIEADWSQAGFWYAAKALGNEIEITGLDPNSKQGDRVVDSHFASLCGAGDRTIDVSDCPDLVPPLAVMAALRQGTTTLTGAARLRIKESDRLATTAALLTALGGQVEEGEEHLTVRGVPRLIGGKVDGANDHRIVMAAAIAATACRMPVTILGAQAVEKSYPAFFEEYQRLGGEIHVL